MNTDHPIRLRVAPEGDYVVLGFGEKDKELVIGLPAATARELAESLLRAVSALEGVEYWVMRGDMADKISPRRRPAGGKLPP